jgi:hypothetical protein
MESRQIFKSKYVEVQFYYTGIFFGVGMMDDSLGIILPFFIIDINLYKLRGGKKNNKRKANEL